MVLMIPVAAAQMRVEIRLPEPTRVAQRLELVGTVTAARDAELSPRVSGLVANIAVDAGDRVHRGDTLLELDATLARLALRRTEAALCEGRTRLAEAQRLRDEAHTLATRGDVPQSQFRTREAEAAQAEAALARLQAEHDEQAEVVARHRLPAPFDGIVRSRLIDPGEWVQTGSAVLALVATDDLRVDVQVPQRYLGLLTDDTSVTVRLDAAPEHPLAATVGARVAAADPATRTFLTRVRVRDTANLAPGMSARLRFEFAAATAGLQIPRDAIKRYPDGSTTLWVVEDGVGEERPVREIPVELAPGSGSQATVVGGLAADQPVVVRGNEGLRAGQTVRVDLLR